MDDSSSDLDQALLAAYRATDYKVFVPRFIIHIDSIHPLLDEWLLFNEYSNWCFITAANPKSVLLSSETNLQRNQQLERKLRDLGLHYYPGEGCSTTQNWPCEPSYWVPSIPITMAIELAIAFGQNAIIYGAFAQKAKLIWTTPRQNY